MNNSITIAGTGGILLGVGVDRLTTDLWVGLLLIGVGVVLQVGVVVLQKYGLEVRGEIEEG